MAAWYQRPSCIPLVTTAASLVVDCRDMNGIVVSVKKSFLKKRELHKPTNKQNKDLAEYTILVYTSCLILGNSF